MAKEKRPIDAKNEFKKVTAHYGYQYEFMESVGKEIFAVYSIFDGDKRFVGGYDKEEDAEQGCRYNEKLDSRRYEPWNVRSG